jgi:integrase
MLTAKKVERTKEPGRYRDGLVKGLRLQISKSGAKSWVLRYELHGKERMMGLGSAADFNLKEARERARSARQLLADGVDPLAAKHAAKATAKAAAARAITFAQVTLAYISQHETKWTNVGYRHEVLATLKKYAFPVLGNMDVASIDLPHVLRVIEPLWKTKTITMDRLRGRIENVLDYAKARKHRTGDNPARWTGLLDQILPLPRKIAPVVHHNAIDYDELPAFMATLRNDKNVAARALEFLVLTATRTGEVLGATWNEIDLDQATWTIPASRMKGKREHRVALSPAAVELLRKLPREDGNPFVFIGPIAGRGLSRMAMPYVMQRLGRRDVTIHGFRSAFSDWAYETTAHSNHTIEISLAHNVGNEVERAYRRKDMLAKRVRLMADWAKHCSRKPVAKAADAESNNVTPIRGAR